MKIIGAMRYMLKYVLVFAAITLIDALIMFCVFKHYEITGGDLKITFIRNKIASSLDRDAFRKLLAAAINEIPKGERAISVPRHKWPSVLEGLDAQGIFVDRSGFAIGRFDGLGQYRPTDAGCRTPPGLRRGHR